MLQKAVHLCCVMCGFLYSKTVPTLTFFVLKCKFLLYLYPTIYILYSRKLWMPFKDTVKKVIIAIVIITYTGSPEFFGYFSLLPLACSVGGIKIN